MLHHRSAEAARPSRVILLGGSGFLGRALADDLERDGVPTLVLGSRDLDLAAAGAAEVLSGKLDAADTLVFLSAITPDKGRDVAAFKRNVDMGAAVCAALAARPVRHVVYVSSDAVYPLGDTVVNEESATNPGDLYGTMHRAREIMLANVAADTLAVVRPTMIFGSMDSHNSYGPNRFWRQAKAEGRIILGGGGEETRDFIWIEDAVRLMRLVLGHQSVGTLNLVTGESETFDSLARRVAALFDPQPQIIHTTRTLPITHRSFDTGAVSAAFPEYRATPRGEALRRAYGGPLCR